MNHRGRDVLSTRSKNHSLEVPISSLISSVYLQSLGAFFETSFRFGYSIIISYVAIHAAIHYNKDNAYSIRGYS